MDPKNFLEAIITNDSEEATQTFVDLMNSKLSDALEVKKVEIASGLFGEAVRVKKSPYSWGKMITVRDGSSQTFPLHPEHQKAIARLKDGESTSFTDETNTKVTAHRKGGYVHLSQRGSNTPTPVAMSHFLPSLRRSYSEEKERYHFLYPHVPLNLHNDHEYNKLSNDELRNVETYQRELADKLGVPGAKEKSDIASNIQINRARSKYDQEQAYKRKVLDAKKNGKKTNEEAEQMDEASLKQKIKTTLRKIDPTMKKKMFDRYRKHASAADAEFHGSMDAALVRDMDNHEKGWSRYKKQRKYSGRFLNLAAGAPPFKEEVEQMDETSLKQKIKTTLRKIDPTSKDKIMYRALKLHDRAFKVPKDWDSMDDKTAEKHEKSSLKDRKNYTRLSNVAMGRPAFSGQRAAFRKEEVEQVDEAIRGYIQSYPGNEAPIRRPADQAERNQLARNLIANRKYNAGKKIGRKSGSVRSNAAGMTPSQKISTALRSPDASKELDPKKFPYMPKNAKITPFLSKEEIEQIDNENI